MACYHQQCLIQTALREEELIILILDDEIDEIIIPSIPKYEEKDLKSVFFTEKLTRISRYFDLLSNSFEIIARDSCI